MEALHEQIYDARGNTVQGVVLSVDDTGQAQTITVQTHSGITRTGIEVQSIFGFASMPPIQGAVVNLLAIGGDPGQYIALPLCNPSFRYGGMAPGDGGCIYAEDGSRVRVRAGGIVEIFGFNQVIIQTPGVSITAPNGVAITGPTAITGDMTVTGDFSTTGTMSIGGDLSVAGNGAVNGDMNVGGTVTAAGFVTA
jgi:phage gp45-like